MNDAWVCRSRSLSAGSSRRVGAWLSASCGRVRRGRVRGRGGWGRRLRVRAGGVSSASGRRRLTMRGMAGLGGLGGRVCRCRWGRVRGRPHGTWCGVGVRSRVARRCLCGPLPLWRSERSVAAVWAPCWGIRGWGMRGGRWAWLVAFPVPGGDGEGQAGVAGPVDVECRPGVVGVGFPVAALAVADEGGGVAVVGE
jgi:hypothetical protein